jgi:hypothetical protein
VLVWDNLNSHVSAAMDDLIGARDWSAAFLASTGLDLTPFLSLPEMF